MTTMTRRRRPRPVALDRPVQPAALARPGPVVRPARQAPRAPQVRLVQRARRAPEAQAVPGVRPALEAQAGRVAQPVRAARGGLQGQQAPPETLGPLALLAPPGLTPELKPAPNTTRLNTLIHDPVSATRHHQSAATGPLLHGAQQTGAVEPRTCHDAAHPDPKASQPRLKLSTPSGTRRLPKLSESKTSSKSRRFESAIGEVLLQSAPAKLQASSAPSRARAFHIRSPHVPIVCIAAASGLQTVPRWCSLSTPVLPAAARTRTGLHRQLRGASPAARAQRCRLRAPSQQAHARKWKLLAGIEAPQRVQAWLTGASAPTPR